MFLILTCFLVAKKGDLFQFPLRRNISFLLQGNLLLFRINGYPECTSSHIYNQQNDIPEYENQ